MATTQTMTADEFLAMPDDGWRYELIEGVPRRMPPTGVEHGSVSSRLIGSLDLFVQPHRLGIVLSSETGFLFQEEPPVVRAPDVAFVRAERLPPRSEWQGYSRVVPDLAIEVVSPDDAASAIAEKVSFYLTHGVPLVWVAYPSSREVVVHHRGREPELLDHDAVLDGEDVLPGFRLPVADLFG